MDATNYEQIHNPTLAEIAAVAKGNPLCPRPIIQRVPLSTPVTLWNGVEAIISGWSTCDCQNYQVTWFNRRLWRQQFRWVGRSKFEVHVRNETAIAA